MGGRKHNYKGAQRRGWRGGLRRLERELAVYQNPAGGGHGFANTPRLDPNGTPWDARGPVDFPGREGVASNPPSKEHLLAIAVLALLAYGAIENTQSEQSELLNTA